MTNTLQVHPVSISLSDRFGKSTIELPPVTTTFTSTQYGIKLSVDGETYLCQNMVCDNCSVIMRLLIENTYALCTLVFDKDKPELRTFWQQNTYSNNSAELKATPRCPQCLKIAASCVCAFEVTDRCSTCKAITNQCLCFTAERCQACQSIKTMCICHLEDSPIINIDKPKMLKVYSLATCISDCFGKHIITFPNGLVTFAATHFGIKLTLNSESYLCQDIYREDKSVTIHILLKEGYAFCKLDINAKDIPIVWSFWTKNALFNEDCQETLQKSLPTRTWSKELLNYLESKLYVIRRAVEGY